MFVLHKRRKFARTVTFSRLGSWGQFGNQLFQISAVLGYAAKHGARACLPPWQCTVSGRNYGAIFTQVKAYYGCPTGALYNERNFMYGEIPILPRIDLRGNFQSEKYFVHTMGTLRCLFAEPAAIGSELGRYCAVNGLQAFDAMHLRSYSNPVTDKGPLEALPDKYYLRAIARLDGSGPLVIATDDKSWLSAFTNRNKIQRELHVLNFADPLLDFFMLSRARRIAISNSSFSWWAAYLGAAKDTIIAPQRYYWSDRKERANPFWNTSTLYPANFEEQIF